jgi:hypothetical protein
VPADTPAPADQLPPGAKPGGCDYCTAYRTVITIDGVPLVGTHHADACPTERELLR